MKILTFSPTLKKIEYTLHDSGAEEPLCAGSLKDWRSERRIEKLLREIKDKTAALPDAPRPESGEFAIAVRAPFGGDTFTGTEIVNDCTVEELEKYIPYSPLHIPPVIS